MNRMMQQFHNLKSNQEGDKANHEKKINERMNKMEKMIRKARKME